MEAKTWPFRPQHITNDGETEKGDLRQLTGEGIISNEYLRGIQTSICAELENPTTIIEFSPDGTCVRTDSQLLIYSLHAACRCFREKTEAKFCEFCDTQYASLFRGLRKSDIPNVLNNRIEENSFITKYRKNPDLDFSLQKKHDRIFLEYDCPILGYRELIFPIFFNDQVVAAFFVGELCLEARKEFIQQRQAEFFDSPPGWIGTIKQNCDVGCLETTRKLTIDAHAEWIKDSKNILDQNEYNELIKKTCKQLKSFEKKLDDEMELHRLRYVRTHIELINKEFKQKLATPHITEGDNITWLWKSVKQQLENIRKEFAFQFVVVFAAHQPMERDVIKLEPVAYAGRIPSHLSDEVSELFLDVKQIVNEQKINPESKNDQLLLRHIHGLKKILEPSLNRCYWLQPPVFSSQFPANANRSIGVWICYPPENAANSDENKESESLDIALKSFFDLMITTYSSILAGMIFNHLESTVRIFSHEAGQLTSGLDWLRLIYLKDANRLRKVSDQKADDLSRDILGLISQLFALTQMTSFISKKIEANKQLFWPYKEILFKWNDIYRLELREKGIKLFIHYPKQDDPMRPQIYGDQKLLEQLVYNLISNAIKYCYRGTNIYLDAQKADFSRNTPYTISVIDFGIGIIDEDDPYGLYQRGKNVPQQDGMGIGLYIARKIADAHGGRIWHTCQKISNYNVPLIQPFLHLPPYSSETEKSLTLQLKAEMEKLIENGDYYLTVALDADGNQIYKPTFGEIFAAVSRPIYKVSFFVEIPSWEVRK